MSKLKLIKSILFGGAAIVVATHAQADAFNIPGGDLGAALAAYSSHTGVELLYLDKQLKGIRTHGARGELTAAVALSHILAGTGFVMEQHSNAVAIVRDTPDAPTTRLLQPASVRIAAAAASAGIESVVVTSSKIKGDIQTVPIAITALSQEQLTSRQIAGGPDLVKEVPNLTFSKTNFTGYNIQIRGIGTQAISVTTDPAVAVALNDIPFIRNHFFEQEFYDVGQVEVLRGPQGTLYGRNATAGVVNVVSAKPTDQFEAMLSADWGNFTNRRYEGMVNIPIVDDRVDLRVAGEWTKRDGYTTNENTGDPVDGRDLWSTRVTLGWKPVENMQAYLVWEHFQESDDRMRTQKQLCKQDTGDRAVTLPTGESRAPVDPQIIGNAEYLPFTVSRGYLSQGCLPTSMYSADAFQVPYGYSLGYVEAGYLAGQGSVGLPIVDARVDPYASTVQSRNLRVIETQINPKYLAKNDTLELNADYNLTPALTFSSQTGYNNDFLWSTEDYNRFNTSPDVILDQSTCSPGTSPGSCALQVSLTNPDGNYRCNDNTLEIGNNNCVADGHGIGTPTGTFCDPQLGCSNKIVAQDLSKERAWQLSQEFRLASNFTGPLNFSVGGNYMHYETVENYYVFINTLNMLAAGVGFPGYPDSSIPTYGPGFDNSYCLSKFAYTGYGYEYHNPASQPGLPINTCMYIDPNPLSSVNDQGHSYFLSKNPYVLNSYAGFGEVYYNVTSDVKLTGGLRWTDDEKHFTDIPSELLVVGYGYLPSGQVDQKWNQWTGRLAANWTPKLDFTDQTLVYGSFAHGYKAGGANPPGAVLVDYRSDVAHGVPVHPLTFKPEFVDAYELGTKNTLLDGGLTLNGDVFYYNYKGYQISKIVDRTAINDNFDATVKGAELEAMYEPIPGLKFNFAGGYEDTRIKDGQSSIDLMDRTAGHTDWVLMKPFVSEASNCILPAYVVYTYLTQPAFSSLGNVAVSSCGTAYGSHMDPAETGFYHYNNGSPYHVQPDGHGDEPANGAHIPYPDSSIGNYPGFDPLAGTPNDPYVGQNTYNGHDYGPAPNNGEGFTKDLSGNELPNAPHFTVSLSGEYTMPVSESWAATLHSDFYWQSQSFARVFNDRPYDKIRGYSNVNLALILTSAEGWQVMGYLKNVFDTTAITGAFLNSDDSGLTTNVFLTDPRLFGVRVTKNW